MRTTRTWTLVQGPAPRLNPAGCVVSRRVVFLGTAIRKGSRIPRVYLLYPLTRY
jgi:hypothetical protein